MVTLDGLSVLWWFLTKIPQPVVLEVFSENYSDAAKIL